MHPVHNIILAAVRTNHIVSQLIYLLVYEPANTATSHSLRVSHVVVGANERWLYSQATCIFKFEVLL